MRRGPLCSLSLFPLFFPPLVGKESSRQQQERGEAGGGWGRRDSVRRRRPRRAGRDPTDISQPRGA